MCSARSTYMHMQKGQNSACSILQLCQHASKLLQPLPSVSASTLHVYMTVQEDLC